MVKVNIKPKKNRVVHRLLGTFVDSGEYRRPMPGEYYLCERTLNITGPSIGLATMMGLSERKILVPA